MTRIVLHIDRLILRGFEGLPESALVEGLREALAGELAASWRGELTAGGAGDRAGDGQGAGPLGPSGVRAATVAIAPGLPARAVGQRLGRGIAAGLAR